MIIRFTLKTNLYTQIIEKYLDDGGPFVITYHNSQKEYKQFKRNVKTLNNDAWYAREKKNLQSEVSEVIKQNFFNYINSIDINSKWRTPRFDAQKINTYKDFIFRHFEVKIVNLLVDSSYNHEVVFYIDRINDYITL